MTTLTHTVTVKEGFTVVGVFDPSMPDEMEVNISGVDLDRYTGKEYDTLFDEAVNALDAHFDLTEHTVIEPVDGMTITADADTVCIHLVGENDGTLLGNAKMADLIVDRALR